MVRWRNTAIGLAALLAACGDPQPKEPDVVIEPAPPLVMPTEPGTPWPFAAVDDNVKHDTLLVQVTFDLRDGTFLMVAGHVDETFEGLRLYRYRARPDSSAEILAYSSPGYDSWTMLPSVFPQDTARPAEAQWILANFGERESWGQKLLWYDHGFTDRGFLDVALPERVMEDDTLRLKRRNIGPMARVLTHNDTTYIRFACDSVFLYDDQAGRTDQVLPGNAVYFTYHAGKGLALWVNGKERPVKQPA